MLLRKKEQQHDSYMRLAKKIAKKSKDPHFKVGACVVSKRGFVHGVAYNDFPRGNCKFQFPWKRHGNYLETKYPYICHAEIAAIINAHTSLKGGRIYVTAFPCNDCAKAIIQSGITEVIYAGAKSSNSDSSQAASTLFKAYDIKVTHYEKNV